MPASVVAVVAVTLLAGPALVSRAAHDGSGERRDPNARAAPGARPLALLENRRVLSYPFEQVWPTAIRYLRIDRGFTVTDRDEDAGYIMFEFDLDGDRVGSGSLEMFRTEDVSGRPSVSVTVSTGAGPVHLPHAIVDGLAAKVRAERGQPAPPPKPEEPPKDDGDKDDDDDHSVPLMPPAQDP